MPSLRLSHHYADVTCSGRIEALKQSNHQKEFLMPIQEPLKTVGELIEQLKKYDPSTEVNFSGLDFYRFKKRGDNLIQCEFNQAVYRDKEGNVQIVNVE